MDLTMMQNGVAREVCPICLGETAVLKQLGNRPAYRIVCDLCTTYNISSQQISYLRTPSLKFNRTLLSAVTRYYSEGGEPVWVENVDELLASAPIPKSPLDAMDNLLLFVGEIQKSFDEYVNLPPTRFYIRAARTQKEFEYVRDQLIKRGFCQGRGADQSHNEEVRLTPDGWARLDELRASRPDSKQAFVAMSFSSDLKTAWTEGIKPALEENGYIALRLDAELHNEKIDDKIIVEIRRSGLVVADVTEQKTGVYFEAGFAMGIPVPVIWCCREDDLPKVHFDTRQFNYVVWKTPTDLREALSYRIKAMYAARTLMPHK